MSATDPKKCMTCKEPMHPSPGHIELTGGEKVPTTVWSCRACGTKRWDSYWEHKARQESQPCES